jgi:thioredoxin reductase (NADPH)
VGDAWDCIVVGAGPGGWSAALYLARFRRRVLVLHDGCSRAARIPRTHNAPGFPDGVTGPELLERMQRHAQRYGAALREAEVVAVETAGPEAGFSLTLADGERLGCRALVLATGLRLQQIPLPDDVHEAAIAAGVLRYCPVCDGFEHIGQRVAVIGCDGQGAAEALFLRTFSDDITLLPRNNDELSGEERARLESAGITVDPRPVVRYAPSAEQFVVHVEGAVAPLSFDVVYPALGCRQRNELAVMLGLEVDDTGSTHARSPFGTQVAGLYCVGDIVDGLDQISVAMGHGAVAATRAHNWLREQEGRRAV